MTLPDPPPDTNRRRFPRWAIAAIAVVLLVVTAGLALPALIDVERHRQRAIEALQSATGWQVSLGEMRLSIFGGLALRVRPVALRGPDGLSSIEIDTLSARARIWPLFRGRLEVDQVTLASPRITVVRSNLSDGWGFPTVGKPAAESPGETPPGTRTLEWAISSLRIREGQLRLEDRVATPPTVVEWNEIDLTVGLTRGDFDGSARWAAGGRLRLTGRPDTAPHVELQDVPLSALAPWLGPDAFAAGGTIDGAVRLKLPEGIEAQLQVRGLRRPAGLQPIDASIDLAAAAREGGWHLSRLEVISGAARIECAGSLTPILGLDLRMNEVPLEAALLLVQAFFPVPVDIHPPGTVSLHGRVKGDREGSPVLSADGEISAARFGLGPSLPPAQDVRARLQLQPDGQLSLDVIEGQLGGGELRGTVRVATGQTAEVRFDGTLEQAGLSSLLAGWVPHARERVSGAADLSGRVGLDLNRSERDAEALSGRLILETQAIELPGWDIEQALRKELDERLGGLAQLFEGGRRSAPDPAPESARSHSIDRLRAELDMNQSPWALEGLELVVGGVTATGRGRLDLGAGTADVDFIARCTPELTARLVERRGELRRLVDPEGRLSVPLRLVGPVVGPSLRIDLGRALAQSVGGSSVKREVKNALKDALKERLRAKTKDVTDDPSD